MAALGATGEPLGRDGAGDGTGDGTGGGRRRAPLRSVSSVAASLPGGEPWGAACRLDAL